MEFLYKLSIFIYRLGISLSAAMGNKKAKQWIFGRQNIFEKLKTIFPADKPVFWFHCASLGEFEQGRSLIEELRAKEKNTFFVLTFFSPSGYELKKDYSFADYVSYLPLDTKRNASEFIRLINPSKVFFIKYEYWYYYFTELKNKNIAVFIISGIFRKQQIFFKWYGGLMRKILSCVTCFFVQDKESENLLENLGLKNVIVSGDTRFDRVVKIKNKHELGNTVFSFTKGYKTIIAGSTWQKDEENLLFAFSKLNNNNLKLIIAPHEITEIRINSLVKLIQSYHFEYSLFSKDKNDDSNILILDTIGMLSGMYRYGNIAYIGGGFGKGIHNTLEAATFGLPVIFGPNYHRFREANDLIEKQAAFSIQNKNELYDIINSLLNDEMKAKSSGKASNDYVEMKAGSTEKILKELYQNYF